MDTYIYFVNSNVLYHNNHFKGFSTVFLINRKNRFINELMQGLFGEGEGGRTEEGYALPSGKPATIQISCSYTTAGKGIYLQGQGLSEELHRKHGKGDLKWRLTEIITRHICLTL